MSLLLLFDDATVTITATPGNAVADGVLSSITRTIPTTPSNAIADGLTTGINQVVSFSPGNSIADGVTATITNGGDVVISCIPGDAVADGVLAAITVIPSAPTQAYTGGYYETLPRRKKKKEPEEDITAEIEAEIVPSVAKAKRIDRLTLEKMIGKKAVAEMNRIDLEVAIQKISKAKRRKQEEELLLLM